MMLRVLGIALAAAIAFGCWYCYENYNQFANVARWTGDKDLRWIRPWLVDFRMPILCAVGFLGLSVLSWAWSKLKLGH